MSAAANSPPQDILVPISVGELIDKIVILEIKSERIRLARQKRAWRRGAIHQEIGMEAIELAITTTGSNFIA